MFRIRLSVSYRGEGGTVTPPCASLAIVSHRILKRPVGRHEMIRRLVVAVAPLITAEAQNGSSEGQPLPVGQGQGLLLVTAGHRILLEREAGFGSACADPNPQPARRSGPLVTVQELAQVSWQSHENQAGDTVESLRQTKEVSHDTDLSIHCPHLSTSA